MNRSGKTSFTDLICVAVIVALGSATLIAARAKFVAHDNALKCASNLRQIGLAMLLYSNNERNGDFPRTIYDAAHTDKIVFGTPYDADTKLGAVEEADPFFKKMAVAANDVTGGLFLLRRTQDLPPEVFVCPATTATPWDLGGGGNTSQNWSNWQGKKGIREHLSFSYQNPYPTPDAVSRGFQFNNSVSSEFVLAADMNPGVDELLTVKPTKLSAAKFLSKRVAGSTRPAGIEGIGTPESTNVTIDGKPVSTEAAWTAALPPKEIRAVNSPNHGGMGQNVLFGDFHVEFVRSPFVGTKGDNIYTRGTRTEPKQTPENDWKESLVGSPYDADDTVLLPSVKQLAE